MNILLVLYGDFYSNSANPLALYARELQSREHTCAIAVPSNLESISLHENPAFIPVLYGDVLASPDSVFPDGRPADVIHACTPREVVRHFVTSYMAMRPTPLVIYLEDHESWIATRALGLDEATLLIHSDKEISEKLPAALSHPFRYDSFIGLADAVAVIQDKLKVEVPPWVHCETVMLGVDLDFFAPRSPDTSLKKKYGIAEGERVIVYHGGIDQFKASAIETLCRAVGLINRQGYPCKLLRTGLLPLEFLRQLPPDTASAISDLGMLPKQELPNLLALADVFVQPGEINPFEDLRLPGKVPEFLAMGRPVVMPDVGISHLFKDGVDAVLLRSGDADEITAKCVELFSDPRKAGTIGRAGRLLAEKYFDVKLQARRLESVYNSARDKFDPSITSEAWRVESRDTAVASLLSRKLRLLAELDSADRNFSASELLREHARYIELMQRRLKGLVGRDEELGRLTRSIAERDRELLRLTQAVADRDRELTRLVASPSWRLTAPLRAAKFFVRGVKIPRKFRGASLLAQQKPCVGAQGAGLCKPHSQPKTEEVRQPAPDTFLRGNIKRVRLILAVVPNALKRSGGVSSAVKKCLTVLRHEGWHGIKRRLVFLHAHAMHAPDGSADSERNDYAKWVRRYDTLTNEFRAILRTRNTAMAHKPLISVAMPIYNPKPEWLVDAIESVRKQIYTNWELCIASDASSGNAIRLILERYAKEDARFKVVFCEQDGHGYAPSNAALDLATGQWVALLDQDDLLAEHALFWVADAINRQPHACLIYTDEDKINDVGLRFAPYFKCDWNLDLFYSHNMFSHLGVFQTKLLREIGGFRVELECAQTYDLTLRCIERIDHNHIHHIPRVLYHRRAQVENTASSVGDKSHASLAGERALNEHFQRRRVDATAKGVGHGYRVTYCLPDELPLVTLIIPTKNGLNLIRRCIKSILEKTTYPNYEILIIDNGSDDPAVLQYFKLLESESKIRVIQDPRSFNFSALNNAGVILAKGELVGLVNNDIEVISADWLSEMVSLALQPRVGAVGARLWYSNNTLQHAGVVLGLGGVASHSHKYLPREKNGYFGRANLIQSYSAVTAACMVVRKVVYEEVGGLNETDLKVAFNDVDFCLRVRAAGYRNVWTPYADLYHHESATRGIDNTPEKMERFSSEILYMQKRWGNLLLNDPAYSPNLTHYYEDFSLAWPPRVDPIIPAAQRSSSILTSVK